MKREPKRLEHLPDTGRVLLAHPDDERLAIVAARAELCDYRLNPTVEPGDVYIVNVDQVLAPSDWSHA